MTTTRVARTRVRFKGTKVYVEPLRAGLSSGLAYDAAATGGRGHSWRAPNVGPNAALTWSHTNLVARSRDSTRKNPLSESAVSVWETNVIGTGITPQWMTSDPGLNRELGELWLAWTDEADADGRLDFYGAQALGVRAVVEAGEVFGRFRVRLPDDMSSPDIVPLQIQLLESEFCPVDEFRQLQGGDEVQNGIQFNAFGRRTAYWMYRRHPQDWMSLRANDTGQPVPVPATEVFHVAPLRRPGQLRGEPMLARALIKLRDFDKYDDAEVMRKQAAALVAGFITSPVNESDEYGGETVEDDGGVSVSWEPATLQKLRPGEDIRFSEPTEVGGTYEMFMRQQQRLLAISAGVLYEQLTGDYSQINDRLLRGALNEFRRRAQMWQHHIVVFQMCRPVVRRWVDIGVLAGVIRPPRSVDLQELYRVRWLPQRWAYLHPEQDVRAQIAEIRGGLTSRASIVAERGDSVEQIDEEQAADNARADALGLAYDSDGRRSSSGGGGQARGAAAAGSRDDEDGAGAADDRPARQRGGARR